jgi:uncharacterized membrane protein
VGGVADKEVYNALIISQRQYFIARCLSFYIGNVFGLHSICVCFTSARRLVTYAKGTVWSRVLYSSVFARDPFLR